MSTTPWLLRALWLLLPFTAGQVFADALADRSSALQTTATVGLWVAWSVGMVCTLIPHTSTLTPLRVLAPAAFGATVWATVLDDATAWAVVALSISGIGAVLALSPPVGAWFVNGSSYGDERRMPLRPPGLLLVGPIPLVWALVVAGIASGPLLLAVEQWIPGIAALAVGLPLAALGARALHRLTRRWLVFVPAGLVVHDHMSLADPVLFKRAAITNVGPALVGSGATDLSQGAVGLAIEIGLRSPVEVASKANAMSRPRIETLDAVVVSPSRPGAVLDEARRRRIAVG